MGSLRQTIASVARRVWPAPVSEADQERRRVEQERYRIAVMPRYAPVESRLTGTNVKAPDGLSFLAMADEIITRGVYEFDTAADRPRILDLGANIGLSVIYFKSRFPTARVTAFEADPSIFSYLQANVTAAGFTDVELVNKAVWDSETTLTFSAEGADGGRVAGLGDVPGGRQTEVPTVRLWDYLTEPVELLKIDIEGAELRVLTDALERLSCVNRVFVEYHSFANEPQRLDELLGLLKRAGMRVWADAVSPRRHPFRVPPTSLGMDMQLNIFAHR